MWPFARIVDRNGRIMRDHVWVDGRDEHHPEDRYYLEWYEDEKRRRKPVESYDLLLPATRAKSEISVPGNLFRAQCFDCVHPCRASGRHGGRDHRCGQNDKGGQNECKNSRLTHLR